MWKSVGILRLLRLLEHRSIAAVALVLNLVMIGDMRIKMTMIVVTCSKLGFRTDFFLKAEIAGCWSRGAVTVRKPS